jgi:hypothetical protein
MAATAVVSVMASKVDVNYLPIDLKWIKEDLIKTGSPAAIRIPLSMLTFV